MPEKKQTASIGNTTAKAVTLRKPLPRDKSGGVRVTPEWQKFFWQSTKYVSRK